MSNITLLFPNARRCLIKVSPNTFLSQAVEDACLKHGFDLDDYIAHNQKKVIDLGLPYRLSGLHNNALLELSSSGREKNFKAEVALQLENGQRQSHSFNIFCSLREVINHFASLFQEDLGSQINDEFPSCMYMNKRYSANELETLSLSDIGISGGRCLIRAEEAKKRQNFSNEYKKTFIENKERARIEGESFKKLQEESEQAEEEKRLLAVQAEPMQTEQIAEVDNAPIFNRGRIPTPPPTSTNSTWSFDQPFNSSAPTELPGTRREEENRITVLRGLIQQIDNSLGIGGSSDIVELLAENGRMSVSQIASASSAMQTSESTEQTFVDPCDRVPIYFDKSKVEQSTNEEDESMEVETDEFFDVSVSDVKRRQRELREEVQNQSQRALVPKSFVDKKNKELKLIAYKHTVVRYVLGNYVVQANFLSAEPVIRLFTFFQSLLSTKCKFNLNFALNDPVEQSETKNLVEANVAPKATIYVKFKSDVSIEQTLAFNTIRAVCTSEADSIGGEWLSANSIYQPFKGALLPEERPAIPKRSADYENQHQPPAKSQGPKWLKFK
ncbi:unnamed protein product [Auanema sp. JU1783]|nr:unnamed protein product [Auanema sp. JU1783]